MTEEPQRVGQPPEADDLRVLGVPQQVGRPLLGPVTVNGELEVRASGLEVGLPERRDTEHVLAFHHLLVGSVRVVGVRQQLEPVPGGRGEVAAGQRAERQGAQQRRRRLDAERLGKPPGPALRVPDLGRGVALGGHQRGQQRGVQLQLGDVALRCRGQLGQQLPRGVQQPRGLVVSMEQLGLRRGASVPADCLPGGSALLVVRGDPSARTGVRALQRRGDPQVQQPPPGRPDAQVGHLADPVVAEVVAVLVRAAVRPDDPAAPQLVQSPRGGVRIDGGGLGEQLDAERPPDGAGDVHQAAGRFAQPRQAGLDHRLDPGAHR